MAATDIQRISFHFQDVRFSFTNRNELKKYLARLFKEEGKEVDHINYIFCSDESLLAVNQQYLGHDTYTDIITFELSPRNTPLLSDIFISIDRVRENAAEFAVPVKTELHRVILHGALHLCGYKDKSPKDSKLMRKMEDLHLNRYFRST